MSATKAIVLLSGGLDSATTLAIARDRGFACHCLAFDYGQRHAVELHAARLVADQLHAESFRIVKVDLRSIGGSALTADIAVPKDRSTHDLTHGIPVTYVPARNLIFLSIASGLAESLGADHLFIGVNAVDYSGYPDCRRPFIDAFEKTVALGTRAGVEGHPFRVHTPLVDLTKADIIRTGAGLGVNYALTTSCYDPSTAPDHTPIACGHCDSCQIRAAGFRDAGVPDPTRYR